MKDKTIILCEPQCIGFEHSQFNAAFLQVIRLAYPDAYIRFYAQKEHIEWIISALKEEGLDITGVEWREINVPGRFVTGWKRLAGERILMTRIFHEAEHSKSCLLVFTSIAGAGLFALKMGFWLRRVNVPVVTVYHGCLGEIDEPQPRRPWNWLLGIRQVLRMPQPDMLYGIVLGESILAGIRRFMGDQVSNIISVTLPVFLQRHTAENENEGLPVFGFVGAGSRAKGFAEYCDIAGDIRRYFPGAHFILAGFASDSSLQAMGRGIVTPLCHTPMPRAEYVRWMCRCTHICSLAKPERYRYVASASFADAIAFAKPIIGIENEYLKFYFQKMGNIGHLFSNVAEMKLYLRNIATRLATEDYMIQKKNILAQRSVFAPENVAVELRDKMRATLGLLRC